MLWRTDCEGAPLSLDLLNNVILMGTKSGSIVEMQFNNDVRKLAPNRVMTSHCDGETWGLDVIEFKKGEARVITTGDDNRLLAYDIKSRLALAEGIVNDPAKGKLKKPKKGYRGGASSMSS